MSIRQYKKSMRRVVSGSKSDALGKSKPSPFGRSLALAPLGVLLSGIALASPQGGQVVGGAGSIAQPTSTQTIVNQQTQKMAIDWQSFNLAAGESVRFNQPSTSAAVLNRILDQNPSQIFGSIQANGRVFLANPNGIVFGESATINVGSFLATTLSTSVTDFMLGGTWTLGGEELSAGGAIVNRGLIAAATGGSVTLVGGSVLNEGTIIATLGSVNLASGKVATLDFDGDGLLSFAVSGEVLENASNAASAVANTGSITADGGQVLLTGHAAKDVFAKVVNNEGIIQANSINTSGGTIRLVGGETGIVANSGTLRAKGDDSGEKGGTVHMLGEKVGLLDAGKVDVSGDAGGGTALIGGDYQGKNAAIRNASVTYVGPNATIDASAMGIGDGGKVIVWGADSMAMHGTILARGGLVGGDGGFVETSSHGGFAVTKAPDVGATMGVGGLWLIDPYNLTIDNTADSNVSGFEATGTGAHITWDTIDDGLFTGDVLVATGSSGTENGDITIAAAGNLANLTSGKTLTLQAADDIFVNFGITGATGALVFDFTGTLYLTDVTFTNVNVSATGHSSGTIQGHNNGMAFSITGTNAGTADSITFTNVASLNGGSGDDSFTLASGVTTFNGTINGGTGNDILAATNGTNAWAVSAINAGTLNATDPNGSTAFSGIDTLTGGTGNDSFTLAGSVTTFNGTINGGTGNDSLNATNGTNAWAVSAINAGTLNATDPNGSTAFSGIDTLTGGTGNDSFTLAGSVTTFNGTINGGTGNDILAATDGANAWAVSAINAGTLNATDPNGSTAFSGIDTLTGGSGSDTLTGLNADTYTITGAKAVILTTGALNATSIDVLNGGSSDDDFTLASGISTFNGTINGGGGTNTLAATDGSNTWNINGANQGTLNGSAFTHIANLLGGSGDDTFVFATAGTLSGDLTGGSQITHDILNLSAKLGTVTINQQTQKATGIAGIFTQIEEVIGNGAGTTLTGSNSGQTFTLTGANAGKAGSLFFSGVANLIGGSGSDTYTGNGGSLSGTITDGAFTGDKTAFIEGGDGGSTTISGSLNVAGLYLNSTSLTINGDIDTGSGTVYLRAMNGNIDNMSTGHTLTTSGNLYLVTSSHTGTVKMNIEGGAKLYLNTWQPGTFYGEYILVENINKVPIINALFDALVGSEFGAHDSIDYFIDPALFDQSISLFSSSEPSVLLPEDQLEETLGKFYRWPAIRLAVLN